MFLIKQLPLNTILAIVQFFLNGIGVHLLKFGQFGFRGSYIINKFLGTPNLDSAGGLVQFWCSSEFSHPIFS